MILEEPKSEDLRSQAYVLSQDVCCCKSLERESAMIEVGKSEIHFNDLLYQPRFQEKPTERLLRPAQAGDVGYAVS